MSDDNEEEQRTPWQIEHDRMLALAKAEMESKERELWAAVEGNGNEYAVCRTLNGEVFLIMTQEACFMGGKGGNDAKGE